MLWHEQLRRLAKLAVTGDLHFSDVLGYVRRKQMRDCALILMYYRVRDPRDMQRASDPSAPNRVNMFSPAAGREPLVTALILGC